MNITSSSTLTSTPEGCLEIEYTCSNLFGMKASVKFYTLEDTTKWYDLTGCPVTEYEMDLIKDIITTHQPHKEELHK